jgi:hypothetical protein
MEGTIQLVYDPLNASTRIMDCKNLAPKLVLKTKILRGPQEMVDQRFIPYNTCAGVRSHLIKGGLR